MITFKQAQVGAHGIDALYELPLRYNDAWLGGPCFSEISPSALLLQISNHFVKKIDPLPDPEPPQRSR